MQTNTYQGLKINHQLQQLTLDNIVVEAALQININNTPYTVVMRTPNNDIDLIRGLLYAEDIFKNKDSFKWSIEEEENNIPAIINIEIPKEQLGNGYLNKRTLLSVSSCGICGKKELKDLQVSGEKLSSKTEISILEIKDMFSEMSSLQNTFKATGGSHAAAIFNKNNQLLSIKEDIGRHNAVDKTIGELLENKNLKEATYLLVSGRVSYEIVSKAFIAKIPIIVAVSACSSLAIDFAKEFGICLIGFTRDSKMTVYANASSLKK
ncbi:formate dehydrogenase accessory sulfurtransferase FdhD [Polaribacter sp.]|uniref:formate dehydrogenase accessory sulfurtransferase FdhD n=1 Tax=Polaribacter sp. TaxID=1920175 RepID=UPI003F6B1F0E